MPNGISISYQLDQSISILRVVGGTFHFYSDFDRAFCKQTADTLPSDLGLYSSPLSYKQEARLIWVNKIFKCQGQPRIIPVGILC